MRAGCDCFGTIDNASAANSQNKIDFFVPAKFDTLVYQAAARIWLNAAKQKIRNVFLIHTGFDAVDQTGAKSAAAAVMDQDFTAAKTSDEAAGF